VPEPSPPHIDSPQGWLVVGATFLSTFTVFGVAYSFAPFFAPMADEFGGQRSEVALFFAITTFLYFGLGVVTGRISDRIGPRRVLLFGAVAMVIGLLATSRVQNLWTGYPTYGLGVGIGVACAYVPMVATVGLWFERRRSAAMGVAVAGIGVGTLVAAPVVESLIDRYGWRDSLIERVGWRQTYVVLAAATAVLLGVAAIGARRPEGVVGQAEVRPLKEVISGSRSFLILYLSMLILVLALFIPFVFMGDYMEVKGIDGSVGLILAVIGSSSVIGRLGLGALAARWVPIRLFQGSFFVVGASFLVWFGAGTAYPILIVFAVIFGIAYGGFIALAPAVAADLFGPVGLGGILGALYTAAGVGGLIGPPLAGELIDAVGYSTALLVSFGAGMAAFAILLPIRVNEGGR
jgi:MFS family permease